MLGKSVIPFAAIVAASILPNAASAATRAAAVADLNIRSGPGPQYEVIGVIQNNDEAVVQGCIKDSMWCRVSHNGKTGWAYSKYLTAEVSGRRVAVAERPAGIVVPTVTYDEGTAASATTGAATGAIAGALVAGPVGAVVGGTIGAVAGTTVNPPPTIRTYVTAHQVQPIYLDGEVVVGAGVPDVVELRPVPDYQYEYAYVNRQPVLVDPSTRRIVYVYR